jgi:hypothetical protein
MLLAQRRSKDATYHKTRYRDDEQWWQYTGYKGADIGRSHVAQRAFEPAHTAVQTPARIARLRRFLNRF